MLEQQSLFHGVRKHTMPSRTLTGLSSNLRLFDLWTTSSTDACSEPAASSFNTSLQNIQKCHNTWTRNGI